MKTSSILGFALIGTSSVFGAAVEKRQSAQRYCGANSYSIGQQNQAYSAAQAQETSGPFPHNFYNRDDVNFPDCVGQAPPFREWPILTTGVFAAGDDPSTDRIVYKVTANDTTTGLPSTFVYCGVMTHQGAPVRNGFVICRDA